MAASDEDHVLSENESISGSEEEDLISGDDENISTSGGDEDNLTSAGEEDDGDDFTLVGEEDKGEDEVEDEDEVESSKLTGNPAWADAINKILRGSSSAAILSKAKKDADVKRSVQKDSKTELQIVSNEDDEVKDAKPEIEKTVVKKQSENINKREKKNLEWEMLSRKKPSTEERGRERILMKIATKGVVQMFNAVKRQQVTVEKKLETEGFERKREKIVKSINKKDFLDILKGNTDSVNLNQELKAKKSKMSEDVAPTWHVFRDDFMLGAKMKDWDKEVEEKNESNIT